MGRVYLNLCNLSLARESFVKVKVTADQIDAPALKASVDLNLANYYLDQGMIRKAFDSLVNAESVGGKVNAHYIEIEILLCRVRYALIIRDLPLARAAITQAEDMMSKYGMEWIKPKLNLVHTELLIIDEKLEAAATALRGVELQAEAMQLRQVSVEAKLARAQLLRNEQHPSSTLSSLQILEKNSRLLGSRKLKAKSLALKTVFAFEKSGLNDVRAQSQILDFLDQSGLILLRWQCLSLFKGMCLQQGLESAVERYQKDLDILESDTNYDLRMADNRTGLFKLLPLSVVA
jgi:hypothetical protein